MMKIKINPQFKSNHYFTFFHCFYLIFFFLTFSCSATKKLQREKTKEYQSLIQTSTIFDQGFTGFQLYDPSEQKVLFSVNDDKHFTPASNTKIFTFFASINILGDSIPAFRYLVKNDSLIFWGTGDPSFLNPYLTQNERVINFFKNREEKLFFCSSNFQDERFGAGWAWDDYNYSYQPEKSSFPFHGNVVQFEKVSTADTFVVTPIYFENKLRENNELIAMQIEREISSNIFEFNPEILLKNSYKKSHPFKYSDSLFIQLLNDTLDRKVTLLDSSFTPPTNTKKVYSLHVDSLYRSMMQESDNFIAEQLLLLCSDAVFDTLNTSKIIQFVKDSLLVDLPDQANWVDGSGLSRYNMFTPRSIVFLLEKIYNNFPKERLFHIFPAGGENGTIEEYYKGDKTPFVFAKTGTLSNKHCLSGYLKTKSGKVLIFSFMHNNYPNGSNAYKEEMEKILKAIYLAY